jgi:hypothetical protein
MEIACSLDTAFATGDWRHDYRYVFLLKKTNTKRTGASRERGANGMTRL